MRFVTLCPLLALVACTATGGLSGTFPDAAAADASATDVVPAAAAADVLVADVPAADVLPDAPSVACRDDIPCLPMAQVCDRARQRCV